VARGIATFMVLACRVGQDGQALSVGERLSLSVGKGGSLYLSVNDDLGINDGAFKKRFCDDNVRSFPVNLAVVGRRGVRLQHRPAEKERLGFYRRARNLKLVPLCPFRLFREPAPDVARYFWATERASFRRPVRRGSAWRSLIRRLAGREGGSQRRGELS
jgi:hypothetical protein